MKKHSVRVFLVLIGFGGFISSTQASIWYNETNVNNECDFCNIQFPATVAAVPGVPFTIFGQIYEAGATELFGANPAILVEAGYGLFGTDPRFDGSWQWFSASYNAQAGNNDEYQATLAINIDGAYAYTFRFSLDNGQGFTAGDLDGAGSNPDLTFSQANLGSINGASAVPIPGSGGLLVSAIAALGALSRKREK